VKKLFLAVIDLHISEYMEESRNEIITTLVWGVDYEDARETVRKEYETEDAYSSYRSPNSIHLTEALGSPV
jgi:hypothetical protein